MSETYLGIVVYQGSMCFLTAIQVKTIIRYVLCRNLVLN